jgi:hypothetical protein
MTLKLIGSYKIIGVEGTPERRCRAFGVKRRRPRCSVLPTARTLQRAGVPMEPASADTRHTGQRRQRAPGRGVGRGLTTGGL